MLTIVSGGQTGVDRAALDAAVDAGLKIGGWCPSGRLAEDGPIPEKYPLHETESADYALRTEWNVRDSDGTLIVAWGEPQGGTAYTLDMAERWQRPCYVVDLAAPSEGEFSRLAGWLREHTIETLNVAGPRASAGEWVYPQAREFLEGLFRLLADG